MVKNCPVCNGKMKITELKCDVCGLEIKKDFEQDLFSTLTQEQKDFLITFLKCEGNMSEIQKILNINYSSVKRKLSELLFSLNLKQAVSPEKTDWNISSQSTKASDIVKSFFSKEGGIAKIETQQGKVFTVDADQYTIGSFDGLRSTRYSYDVFDMIVNLALSNGGTAKKGNGRNYRVGEKGCELDTLAGMIGHKYHKKQIGESTFDPVFLLVAILDRVGIVYNKRGFIQITEQYKKTINNI